MPKSAMKKAGFGSVPAADVLKSKLFSGNDPKIVLMGDSVLDNFYWLQDRSLDLRNLLERRLQDDETLHDHRCVNLAVDQMSSFDFIERAPHRNGWSQYESARNRVFSDSAEPADRTYAHLRAEDGNIHSVANLRKLKNVKCAVVSLGGNDVYLSRDVQIALIKSLNPFQRHLREEVAEQFRERLLSIFEAFDQVMDPASFVLPVIVYHPHHGFSISGLQSGCKGFLAKTAQSVFLKHLVTPMARQFLVIAQERCLPVLDLSRTFNPNDVTHYGTMDMDGTAEVNWSGAEPSDTSQGFIAELIMHVAKNWTRELGSIVYSGVVEDGRIVEIREDRNEGNYASNYVFSQG